MAQPHVPATFDPADPSSALAYPPSQTALILLDFQNHIVQMCGEDGQIALANAIKLRDWALAKQDVLIMHSVIDPDAPMREDAKGRDRYPGLLKMLQEKPEIGYEPVGLTPDPSRPNANEMVVKKQIGFVSGLTAPGAMETLQSRGIRSLILCGLSTSGAALRTALQAADQGFVVTVVEDGCADGVEGLHEMLVRHALPMTCHVATADELVEAFGRQVS